MAKIQNIPVKNLIIYLKKKGCKLKRINGGHEIWTCENLLRPITFQTHINPVPHFIVMQIIKTLGITKKEFLNEV